MSGIVWELSKIKPAGKGWLVNMVGILCDLESALACALKIAFTSYKLLSSSVGALASKVVHPWFSSAFHKEVLSSTVSAQGGVVFLLRAATICRRVGPPNTWQFSKTCRTNDCGDAGGRLVILEGELPADIRKRA